MDIRDLWRRRAPLMDELAALQAKDALTADEDKRYNDLIAQVKDIDRLIAREMEAQSLANHAPVDDAQDIRNNTGHPFASLGEQLRAVAAAAGPAGQVDRRLYAVKAAVAGNSEGVPADGGYLVQTDFSSELLRRSYEVAVVFSRTRNIPISTNANSIKIPVVAESSRADGSRWGGIQVYRVAEGAPGTGKKPTFDQIELKPGKMMGLCYATDELLADAAALEAYINEGFANEFGFKLDDEVINGTGLDDQMLGILNAPCLVTVDKETSQAAGTIVAANINKMWSRMWAPSRANAVWLINQEVETELEALTMGTQPVYMPPGGLSDTPYGRLKGRPVIPVEQCSALGTKGDILLVDLTQFLNVTKGRMQAAQSIHVEFLTDQTAFRFIQRVGGQPWWKTALTPYKGSKTLSPFIALADRLA